MSNVKFLLSGREALSPPLMVTAVEKLVSLLSNTARRYDVLFGKHADMYLRGENEGNKRALSRAFVERTIDDVVSILNDESLKDEIAAFVSGSTDRVVSKCGDDGTVSVEHVPRLHFSYVYCVNLVPAKWRNAMHSLESVFYRDTTRVYDRYMLVKTVMTDLFKKITDTVLTAVFGSGPDAARRE